MLRHRGDVFALGYVFDPRERQGGDQREQGDEAHQQAEGQRRDPRAARSAAGPAETPAPPAAPRGADAVVRPGIAERRDTGWELVIRLRAVAAQPGRARAGDRGSVVQILPGWIHRVSVCWGVVAETPP